MDAEEKFTQRLLKRQKKNLHLKFFEENGDIQFIVVPVFTKHGPKKKILPYRNKNCVKPGCIYDLKELVEKYKNSMFSGYLQFICHTCRQLLDINDFYMDYTLKGMIDEVWQKHNREDRTICEGVTIMRDGHWEPNLPEYQKYMDRKLNKNLGIPESARLVAGADEKIAKLDIVHKKQRVPHLNQFSREEFTNLIEEFENEDMKSTGIVITRDGIPLRKIDFRTVENETAVGPQMVSYFINYLKDLQGAYPDMYNRYNANRTYYNVVTIKDYDKFSKKIQSEYGFSFKNDIRQKPEIMHQNYDKAIIVFNYDERWIAAVVELKYNRVHIVDFLQEDLSRVKIDDLIDIVKIFLEREFKLKADSYNFYDIDSKLNYYNDCGLYILNYAYKALNNELVQNLRVQFKEKELFRRQLLWLILKMRGQRAKEVDIFKIPKAHASDSPLVKEKLKKPSLEVSIVKSVDDRSFWSLSHQSSDSSILSKTLSLSSHSKTSRSNTFSQSHTSSVLSEEIPTKPVRFNMQESIRKSIEKVEKNKDKVIQEKQIQELRNQFEEQNSPKKLSSPRKLESQKSLSSRMTSSHSQRQFLAPLPLGDQSQSDSSMISMNKSELENIMKSFGKKIRKELKDKRNKKKKNKKKKKMDSIAEEEDEESDEDPKNKSSEEEEEEDSDNDEDEDEDEEDEKDESQSSRDQSQLSSMKRLGLMNGYQGTGQMNPNMMGYNYMYDPNMNMMGGYPGMVPHNKYNVQFNQSQDSTQLFAYDKKSKYH